MKKAIVILGIVAFAACSKKVASPSASGPTENDVKRVSSKFPGYTLAQLNEGKALYEANCGSCHALKAPGSEPEAEWLKEVPPMVKKVNKKAGKVVIDEKGEDLITKYLVTMAKK